MNYVNQDKVEIKVYKFLESLLSLLIDQIFY